MGILAHQISVCLILGLAQVQAFRLLFSSSHNTSQAGEVAYGTLVVDKSLKGVYNGGESYRCLILVLVASVTLHNKRLRRVIDLSHPACFIERRA